MLYQLFETTKDYILNNEKTEIRFRTKYRFPELYLKIHPSISMDRIKEINLEQYKTLKNKHQRHNEVFKYVYNTIATNISQFKYISEFDRFSIICYLKFRMLYHVHCSPPLEYFYTSSDGFMSWMFQITQVQNMISFNESKSKTTSLTININGNLKMFRGSFKFKSSTISKIPFYRNEINKLIIDSSFLKIISNNGKNCIEQKQGLFTYNMKDELIMDCINYELNKTFGCLPAFKTEFIIRLERDLNHFKYTICPINESIFHSFKTKKEMQKQCLRSLKLKPFCETQIFNIFNNHRINDKNFTQIIIIPKNNFIPEYKQNYRMDFNDWIYNCGGIIGLWFGWSAMSMSGVVLFIRHYSKLYYRHFRAFIEKKREKHSINKLRSYVNRQLLRYHFSKRSQTKLFQRNKHINRVNIE